ncbi:hypothetical protein [Streptomyces sp. SGAir0957]
MAYRLGDPIHSAIRCPKPDCNRLLINGQTCGCTWQDPTESDPLLGRPVIAVGENGRVVASGIVTAVERTGDELQLTVDQHPA